MITFRKQLYSPASFFKPAPNKSFPPELLPTKSFVDEPESDVGDTIEDGIETGTSSPRETTGKKKTAQKFVIMEFKFINFNTQEPKLSNMCK